MWSCLTSSWFGGTTRWNRVLFHYVFTSTSDLDPRFQVHHIRFALFDHLIAVIWNQRIWFRVPEYVRLGTPSYIHQIRFFSIFCWTRSKSEQIWKQLCWTCWGIKEIPVHWRKICHGEMRFAFFTNSNNSRVVVLTWNPAWRSMRRPLPAKKGIDSCGTQFATTRSIDWKSFLHWVGILL